MGTDKNILNYELSDFLYTNYRISSAQKQVGYRKLSKWQFLDKDRL